MTYLLAIDQGTSSSRSIIFNAEGSVHKVFQKEVGLFYPKEGWVEQDPQELLDHTVWAVHSALDDPQAKNKIAGIGITNQRETTILWDKRTGKAVYNAIVWQDRRTGDYCERLRQDGVEAMVTEKTGLLLDPYFSATKIAWILDNVDGVRSLASEGNLLFGTVDTFLLWHLTGGAVHVTDSTNASRTMLYNINSQSWDEELLQLFNVPIGILPSVQDNISNFGQIDSDKFGASIAIGGVAGDQQAALIGQGCIKPGMVKSTYGTGCFALMNMGCTPVVSEHKLLTTIAYRLNGITSYALEGAIFNAGTAVQFLRDNFDFFSSAKETEALAASVPDNGGVYFVPAFTGLGAPYWDPSARGMICGLGRDTSKAHIVRAALEAQGYQTRDLIGVMAQDARQDISVLRADGGLTANSFMCQFLADTLDVVIETPKVLESTAWGAACLAGVHAGVFEDLEEATSRWQLGNKYIPGASRAEMEERYLQWKKAVAKTMRF